MFKFSLNFMLTCPFTVLPEKKITNLEQIQKKRKIKITLIQRYLFHPRSQHPAPRKVYQNFQQGSKKKMHNCKILFHYSMLKKFNDLLNENIWREKNSH